MKLKRLPKSVKKHIRTEKARIRVQVNEKEERTKQIAALYEEAQKRYKKDEKSP